MAIPLNLTDAFASEQDLRDMVAARKVCFDHDPFYVRDGSNQIVQIGFQLNLYAAFQDPKHLPSGEDTELRDLIGDLRRLCRVFFQSLDLLKPCEYTEPPMHRIMYAPERQYRAEVCLPVSHLRPGTLWGETRSSLILRACCRYALLRILTGTKLYAGSYMTLASARVLLEIKPSFTCWFAAA